MADSGETSHVTMNTDENDIEMGDNEHDNSEDDLEDSSSDDDDDQKESELKAKCELLQKELTPISKVNKAGKKRKYDPALLSLAFKEVTLKGASIHKAAKMYGIPDSTLRDRFRGPFHPAPDSEDFNVTSGPSTILTAEEEKNLAQHTIFMANIGYGYSRTEFISFATGYAISLGKKKPTDSLFSQSWYDRFKSRHPEITLAKPQKLSLIRAKNTSDAGNYRLINENQYMYDTHINLINNLKLLGDLDKLRNARQRMSELFPLSEDLWLDWIRDESGLVTEDSGREQVNQLFERAVKDYLSVPIWLEYVQFSIGGMGEPDGISKVREVFDKALIACGLHVTKGANLWEAYREFENAILAGLMPAPGVIVTKEMEDKFEVQHDRVQSLFKRQLSVPLFDMEESFKEYTNWLQDDPDNYTKQTHNKALIKLEKVKPYEDNLVSAESPRLQQYQDYIKFEEKDKDPARIQCVYERAIQENCLNPALWLQYTKYLDHSLKIPSVSLPVYERGVRNCPWCVQLWQNYILLMERSEETFEKVKGVFEAALASGWSQGSEYLQLWTIYIDYLRRRIKWEQDHTDELDKLRVSLDKALEQIDYYGQEGDPNGTLRQFWAAIEAKHCNNLVKGRELWGEIMTIGHANEAALWMEYYRFERMYGDNKHCRKVLQRALNSVTDWPESIVDAYINFEREEGNLEQYELAVSRCESQMSRINERREKETDQPVHDNKKKFDKKGQRSFDNKQQGTQKKQQGTHKQQQGTHKQQQGKPKQQQGQHKEQQKFQQHKQNKQQQFLPEPDTEVRPYKRKHERTTSPADEGFKVPSSPPVKTAKSNSPPGAKNISKSTPPPGFKGQSEKSTPPPGFEEKSDKSITPQDLKGQSEKSSPPPGLKAEPRKTAPPPGFKEDVPSNGNEDEEPPQKKTKTDTDAGDESSRLTEHDNSADFRTAFVSNLSYNVDEDRLQSFFSEKCGDIEEIRLIKNFKGRSKGYAYVQFTDQFAVTKALTYDRTKIDNRPMYVSRCEDRSQKSKADFKYATSLEKNKLFVKNLPFTCSKEALVTLFGQHGELKEVRLVTYKSGQSKGLAYVEYVDEQTASAAVMKTDGLQVGDHNISVAISNPPVRRPQSGTQDETSFIPSLGGGKKETQSRGVARTQVMLMPRSVNKKPSTKSAASTPVTQSTDKASSETQSDSKTSTKTSGMSNSDFRNMLLKK